eukprot:sb/3476473/
MDSCVPGWGGDVIARIKFSAFYDQASESYRINPVCPGFTVDGSVQGRWDDTDPGQTVTISCLKGYVLEGSPERTCNSTDLKWNSDLPTCNIHTDTDTDAGIKTRVYQLHYTHIERLT